MANQATATKKQELDFLVQGLFDSVRAINNKDDNAYVPEDLRKKVTSIGNGELLRFVNDYNGFNVLIRLPYGKSETKLIISNESEDGFYQIMIKSPSEDSDSTCFYQVLAQPKGKGKVVEQKSFRSYENAVDYLKEKYDFEFLPSEKIEAIIKGLLGFNPTEAALHKIESDIRNMEKTKDVYIDAGNSQDVNETLDTIKELKEKRDGILRKLDEKVASYQK